ncbi:rhodanese-like domain-containing protein [Sulfurivermis fontis]|uniref:rhodanese-like domain-containing protein n=1 Tax=Sulfurivermis fontis TaxID=1972068 RepID=UPI000FD96F2F|nr:rhodanese-like domain-containing protein [Sulfurivermis fontis]
MKRYIIAGWLLALWLPLQSLAAGAVLSAPEALAAMEAGRLTLVDIRTPPEWRQTGVARGASRLDMRHPQGGQGFVNDLLKMVGGDKNAPIGLICRTGNRTTQVQKFLEAQGFTNIYNVKEGMAGSGAGPGWLRRGLPVEQCTRC